MEEILIYLLLIGLAAFSLYHFLRPLPGGERRKWTGKFRKKGPQNNWVQVYETAYWEEAQQIQSRLEEEGIECILYEQGKKDIHGNMLRGIGVAVPKPTVSFAQKIISRIPV